MRYLITLTLVLSLQLVALPALACGGESISNEELAKVVVRLSPRKGILRRHSVKYKNALEFLNHPSREAVQAQDIINIMKMVCKGADVACPIIEKL